MPPITMIPTPVSPTVLVVDDEIDVGFLIRSFLTSKGLTVEVANTARDCLKQVASLKPTHVILDINLPDGNGLNLLPQVKAIAPAASVFMHSAQDTEENRRLAIERGASGFLKKPLNQTQLLELFPSI